MKLIKIYSTGKIINRDLYERLKVWDAYCFPNCGDEFKKNRDWWVIVVKGKIIAYCGCLYSSGICIFNRAWVDRNFRGNGLQRKMIAARLRAAKERCTIAITYTTTDNTHSANNLIRCKFLLFDPSYPWVGKQLYFRRSL